MTDPSQGPQESQQAPPPPAAAAEEEGEIAMDQQEGTTTITTTATPTSEKDTPPPAAAAAAAITWLPPPPDLDFSTSPSLTPCHQATTPFQQQGNNKQGGGGRRNNFIKALRFSPDGTCLLTSSEDHVVRLWDVPAELLGYTQPETETDENSKKEKGKEWQPSLTLPPGEAIYDQAWYPLMNIHNDPLSACFLTTTRDHPIHLWDAYTGQVRASYRAYDHMDELATAHSVAFSPFGDKIFAGFERIIRVFDTATPGRDHEDRPTRPSRRSKGGQTGIISTLAFSPMDVSVGMFVAGSFAGNMAMYDYRMKGDPLLFWPEAHAGQGITTLKISYDGRLLFSGGRKNNYVHCWDLRKGELLSSFHRDASSNQRVGIDLDPAGRYMATGSRDGSAYVYDLSTGQQAAALQGGEGEAVGDVGFHPWAGLVAVGTGERHYHCDFMEEEEEEEERKEMEVAVPTAVKTEKKNGLWLYQVPSSAAGAAAAGGMAE